jgi:hypothetical protein
MEKANMENKPYQYDVWRVPQHTCDLRQDGEYGATVARATCPKCNQPLALSLWQTIFILGVVVAIALFLGWLTSGPMGEFDPTSAIPVVRGVLC